MFLKDKNQDVIFLFFGKPFYVPLRNDYVATNELQVVIFSALRLKSIFQGLTQNLEILNCQLENIQKNALRLYLYLKYIELNLNGDTKNILNIFIPINQPPI